MSQNLVDSLRIFARVAELGSFTRAAAQLGTSKARVSLSLRALEAELGTQLLARTTRAVRLTPDGEELLPRARRVVLDADELAGMFRAARGLRGRVRIDLPMSLALNILLPKLPELLARHPELEIVVSTTDRFVEPVREGFDCVLRVGSLRDSGLVARKLGMLLMANCASPAYLHKYGVPRRLEDLDRAASRPPSSTRRPRATQSGRCAQW
jgi:DNA-binding transcriptional LysR family regulator